MGLDPHRALDGAGLRVIQAIDQDGGFSGAAARLGVSPAAISQMVCRLEERSGTPLVERRGRQVRLTEAGHVLARHANGVLSRLVIAENEVAAIAGARAGRMRLMAVHTASGALVPRALAAVRRQFPNSF